MRKLLLALLAPLALAQVADTQTATLSIEGTVTHEITGAPVAGARVVAAGRTTSGFGRMVAITDVTGHFQLDGMAPGMVQVAVGRSGYLPDRRSVTLKPGQSSTNLQIALSPQAVIAGVVRDEDGWPVADAQISLRPRDGKGVLATDWTGRITNDRGEFRLAGLTAGTYYLRAEPGAAKLWDPRYIGVYYPAALTQQDAEAIEVAAGQERAGIVVRVKKVAPGVSIQGRVLLPSGFVPPRTGLRARVLLMQAEVPGAGAASADLASDGTFTFRDVQPGKYQIKPELPPPYGRGFTFGRTVVEPNLEVGITDVTGLVLDAVATIPVDLTGTVVFDAKTKPAPVVIVLTQQNAVQAQTASLEDGSFVLHTVPPGKYRLMANATAGGIGITARLGETDLPYGELEVKGPKPGVLTITMGSAFARVTGVVVNAAGQPVAGKFALFRPSKPGLQPMALGMTDSEGHFAATLAPGEYHVWVAAEAPRNWDGKDGPAGQLVTVVEGENPPLRLVMPVQQ